MKITRLRITNFRGISTLDVEVPAAGAVIKGGNAQGKTSVLRAIAAALGGEGLGPDAVRLGADAAEILVDMDALRVRRGITAKGSSLVVKTTEGDLWAKPQTRLTDLLGTAPLDPLRFYEADAKARRRMVLDTVRIEVTKADVERWVGSIPIDFGPVDGHALLVVEQLRKGYYAQRTDANRVSREAAEKLARARAAVPPAPTKVAATVEEAGEALSDLERKRDEVRGRAAAAEKARAATAATRARVLELRQEAYNTRETAFLPISETDFLKADAILAEADATRRRLRAELADADAAFLRAQEARNDLDRRTRERETDIALAEDRERQAADLEQSLTAVDDLAVLPDEIALAERAVEGADAVLRLAIDNAAHAAHLAEVEALAETAKTSQKHAETLDEIVRRLTEDAPRELAARGEMIPGLAIVDDGITLDGVSLDALSGAEQLRFAVDLAKRLNARSKLIVCDGLERLDPARMAEFIKFATADGFQLLGTRVSEGDLVVEAIEPDEVASGTG